MHDESDETTPTAAEDPKDQTAEDQAAEDQESPEPSDESNAEKSAEAKAEKTPAESDAEPESEKSSKKSPDVETSDEPEAQGAQDGDATEVMDPVGSESDSTEETARWAPPEDGTPTAKQTVDPYEKDRKSTRLNSSHTSKSRMPSSA